MHLTGTRAVDDEHYGELTIRTSDERDVVEVSGVRVPTVVLRRSPGVEPNKFVPIGTRKARHLTMTVNGTGAELRPGPGRLTRRSYRIELTLAGTHYKFTPDINDDMLLTRDGTKIASFTLNDDGEFFVHWDSDGAQPADAAIGYALSAAFGTSTTGIFTVLLHGSENLP
ncbi:hypothetical protein [Amycolatopsis albispora]|uniref:Uncharacterized protein n=1 Tax=Amycolatopsis albispora TaxID=1804986 RepID=A0A344L0L9_9PSEU|nr:hypothetical protein [Amycolatopsis albispora]AXB41593.1 hypothetical protein A4R43_02860 [Amycolatopsis albispora]